MPAVCTTLPRKAQRWPDRVFRLSPSIVDLAGVQATLQKSAAEVIWHCSFGSEVVTAIREGNINVALKDLTAKAEIPPRQRAA